MAGYEFYVANDGTPQIGLTIGFSSLTDRDNVVQTFPVIVAISDGWYKFDATIPVNEVWTGVIDADSTSGIGLAAIDRYIPVRLSVTDIYLDIASSTISTDTTTLQIDIDTIIIALENLKNKTGVGRTL